jgi:hypothetical protein
MHTVCVIGNSPALGVPSSRPGRGHASASVSTNANPSTKKFFRSHGFHRDQRAPHPAGSDEGTGAALMLGGVARVSECGGRLETTAK